MSLRPEIPSSVYRLQLNASFPLKDTISLLPYLKELGVEGIYCSPFYDSVNPHGYDVTNSNALNPVLGTMAELDLFFAKVKKLGFSLIIDVVPNHMGIKKGKNAWWQDVLENGPYSDYALFFDIDWSPEKRELRDKVLLPILGNVYGAVLENQEIILSFTEGVFFFHYADFPLPVAPHAYAMILERGKELLKEHPDYKEFCEILEIYHQFPVATQERSVKKEEGKKRLEELCKKAPEVKRFIEDQVTFFNGQKGIASSFDPVDKLLELQFYRLAYWKVASHEINYRRFFNIHELVAICIEKPIVFEAHHRWILTLLKEKKVQGFRIDHPDGLYDPVAYFQRLREHGCTYTIVEKILDRKEDLPEDWEVEGTVGYGAMNLFSGIFIKQDSEKAFEEIYEGIVGRKLNFDDIVYESKKLFALYHMVSEIESLALRLDRLSEKNRHYRDFTRFDLTKALQEVIACFPVYRTYITTEDEVSTRDANYIRIAIEKAKRRLPEIDVSIFEFLEKILLLQLELTEEEGKGFREFVLRFQQLTGPFMAKGLEDTALYNYNRFISLNEVGGDPPHFGHSLGDFHRFNQKKQQKWPYAFISTSTHDSKRSEDVRMRLNVLSEIPKEWSLQIRKWEKVNARYKKEGMPSRDTEYFLYQSLIGVWPKGGLKAEERKSFFERIWEVFLKCLREGQRETNWFTPNTVYEDAVKQFLFSILSPEKENLFLKSFLSFQRKIDLLGTWNSLALIGLKMGSCGVVDIYQGNETWNYCLVDPDNRRPVDFSACQKLLKQIHRREGIPTIDQAKMYLHLKTLNFRKEHKALFLEGEYLPLQVTGSRKENVVAFARRFQKEIVIVCAARFSAELLLHPKKWAFPPGSWEETFVMLPLDFSDKTWTELFTEKQGILIKGEKEALISASTLFEFLPVSYLYASSQ